MSSQLLIGLGFSLGLAVIAFAVARTGLGPLNPMSVYAVVWIVVLLLYQIPALDLRPLSSRAIWLLLTSSASFAIGVVVCAAHTPQGNAARRPLSPRYDERRLLRAYGWATLGLIAYVVLQLVTLWPVLAASGGLGSVLAGGGDAWRRAYLTVAVEQAQTNFTGASIIFALLGYVLFVGGISIFWAGYYARSGRWALALVPMLIMAVYSLVLLQRAAFLYSAALFVFSWYYHRGVPSVPSVAHQSSRRGRTAVVLLLLVPLVVIVPLQLRQPDLTTGEQTSNIITYVDSGLAGLNALTIDDPTLKAAQPDDYTGPVDEGLGVWTFYGAATILARTGLPINTPSNFFNYVPIQNLGTGLSNTFSFVLYFYYDAGWPGVIAMSFAFGLGASLAHKAVVARRNFRVLPLASLLMTGVAMSFFGITVLRDFRYLFLALIGIWLQRCVEPPFATEGASIAPSDVSKVVSR